MVAYNKGYNPNSGDTTSSDGYNTDQSAIFAFMNAFPLENASGVLSGSTFQAVTLALFHGVGNFKVSTGLMHSGMSGLVSVYKGGIAYLGGIKRTKAAGNVVLDNSKWNYVYLQSNGTIAKVSLANGSTVPNLPNGAMWLYGVEISGASGVANFFNLAPQGVLERGNEYHEVPHFFDITHKKNARLEWVNATTLRIVGQVLNPTELVITDKEGKHPVFCRNASNVSIGTSDLDTGSIAANTIYYVYAIPNDKGAATQDFDLVLSTNATAPASHPWSRYVGWVRTDGSSEFVEFNMDDTGWTIFGSSQEGGATSGVGLYKWPSTSGGATSGTWYKHEVDHPSGGYNLVPQNAESIRVHVRASGDVSLNIYARMRALDVGSGDYICLEVARFNQQTLELAAEFSSQSSCVVEIYNSGSLASWQLRLLAVKTPL